MDWELDAEKQALLDFTRRLIRLRADEPVFRRRHFFQGRPITGDVKDIYWVSPAGREMQMADWGTPLECLGVLLVGEEIGELDDDGRPIVGNTFLLVLNAAGAPTEFAMPERLAALDKQVLIDTASGRREGQWVKDSYDLDPHSAVVMLVSRPENGAA